MTTYQFLDDVYDILAQNSEWATKTVRDDITNMIDHVDDDRGVIVFRDDKGREFELQLVKTYAPSSLVAKEQE